DRRREAGDVDTVDALTDDVFAGHDAVVVSTPPDRHVEVLRQAVDNRAIADIGKTVQVYSTQLMRDYASSINAGGAVSEPPRASRRLSPKIQG
ncbi:MAG: hypothetical protein IH969_01170, partial [Candidatus Krumholzibacteriota bacterium]|nr:hypothetical protein [Candidatus Krumholzibacteriota bacterium]